MYGSLRVKYRLKMRDFHAKCVKLSGRSAVSCHRCHTNVHIVISALGTLRYRYYRLRTTVGRVRTISRALGRLQSRRRENAKLRWFETVFHFPLQLNFMKGLLVCSKRLLLLVDSRCYNNLSTYQLLYSH